MGVKGTRKGKSNLFSWQSRGKRILCSWDLAVAGHCLLPVQVQGWARSSVELELSPETCTAELLEGLWKKKKQHTITITSTFSPILTYWSRWWGRPGRQEWVRYEVGMTLTPSSPVRSVPSCSPERTLCGVCFFQPTLPFSSSSIVSYRALQLRDWTGGASVIKACNKFRISSLMPSHCIRICILAKSPDLHIKGRSTVRWILLQQSYLGGRKRCTVYLI